MTTRAGEEIPLKLTLAKLDGAWRVVGLTSQKAVSVPTVREPPELVPLRALVTRNMLDFSAAVLTGKFESFHATISKLWQKQIDPAGLKTAFAAFLDPRVRMPAIDESQLVFDQPPIVDEGGLLHVTGYYVAASRVGFKLDYLWEESWKLVGLKANTNAVSVTRYVPSDAALKPVVQASLVAFAQAIKSRDMKSLYAGVSKIWQQQTTPAGLEKAFAAFVKKKVDLSHVGERAPTFTEPAHTTDEGVLIVTGTVPLTPAPLKFQLKYLYEHPSWRLLGINVSTLE